MGNVSLGRSFTEGWTAFKNYAGLAIGGFLLYAVITAVGQNIPFLNILFVILVMFPLMGGYTLLFLNIQKGADPQIGNLFEGFSDWARWMGVGWLLVVYEIAAGLISAIPLLICWLLSLAVGGPDSGAGGFLIAIGGLAFLVIFIAIMIRWAFVFYAAADEGLTATQAIARSAELTEGLRPQIFIILLVTSLFMVAGVLALGVGVIFTAAVGQCVMTALYLSVKEAKGGAAAAAGVAAPGPASTDFTPSPSDTDVAGSGQSTETTETQTEESGSNEAGF